MEDISKMTRADLMALNQDLSVRLAGDGWRIRVLEERCEQAELLLKEIIDGVHCQPGYIRSITIDRVQQFLKGRVT